MAISILVPIYNVENYIERCAHSLFGQTYHDIEYIFVNDCTPDNSVEILKNIIQEYPQRKEHIRIISHEKNRGLAAARNTAVENCQTEFLMHVDSDDYLEKDAVEKLVKKQREGDYDIVTGNALIHQKDNIEILRKNEPTEKEELINLYIQPVLNHTIWGRLIRTTIYTNNNIKALEGCNIGEDHQVIPKLFYYTNKFSSINDVIYHYDCTNELSYMNQSGDCEKYLLRQYQNTLSFNELRVFFENKNQEFLKQIYKYMPINLERAMVLCIKTKNHSLYKELKALYKSKLNKELLNAFYTKEWKQSLYMNNYLIARISYVLYSFISQTKMLLKNI